MTQSRGELAGGSALPRFPEMVEYVEPVTLRDRGERGFADLTDEELIRTVQDARGRVMIGFKPAAAARTSETGVVPGISRASAFEARSIVEAMGAEVNMSFRYTSAVSATIDPRIAPDIRRLPQVDYIEPSFSATLAQATPPQDTSWGLWQIRTVPVWQHIGAQSTRGELANITMIDSGVDSIHAMSLTGDGPEGVLLDCYYIAPSPPFPGTGPNCWDNMPPPYRGHGAHVGGIIAARNNGYGYIGIAHQPARFASIKICDGFNGDCPVEYVITAIEWAIASGRDRHVVNLSWGFCANYVALQTVVQQAEDEGILVVASAGNILHGAVKADYCGDEPDHLPDWQTSVMYPARYSSVMAVSGVREDGQFAAVPPVPDECGVRGGSRYGTQIEIAAPFSATSMAADGTYKLDCGTSMSAPVVTAVAALVWSRNPGWTAEQVRQRLKVKAFPSPQPAIYMGAGRVDAYDAVYVPTPPVYTASIQGPSAMRPYATCGFQALPTSQNLPFTYEWYLDQWPSGQSTQHIYHTAGASDFELMVEVEDGQQNLMYGTLEVSVDPNAPECFDSLTGLDG